MKVYIKILTSLILVFGLVGQVFAIVIISGDGTETCTNGAPLGPGICTVETISVHNLWQTNNPKGNDAKWISFADTGAAGNTLAPLAGTTPVMRVTETFMANMGDKLALDVWADDTAQVWINGAIAYAPNFTQNICAKGPIGCEPHEAGKIMHTFLAAGLQTLSFDVYQIGSGTTNAANPFGLLYSGTTTNATAPTTFMLMGLGLLGIVRFSRRKRLQ